MINEITIRNYHLLNGDFSFPITVNEEHTIILFDEHMQHLFEVCKLISRLKDYFISTDPEVRFNYIRDLCAFSAVNKIRGNDPFDIIIRFDETFIYELRLYGANIGHESLYNEAESSLKTSQFKENGVYRFHNDIYQMRDTVDHIKAVRNPYLSIIHDVQIHIPGRKQLLNHLNHLTTLAEVFISRENYNQNIQESLLLLKPREGGDKELFIIDRLYNQERSPQVEGLMKLRTDFLLENKKRKRKIENGKSLPYMVINTYLPYSKRNNVLPKECYFRISNHRAIPEDSGC